MGSSTATHQGIVCDKSGMNPIVGTRYSLRGQNYDLCEAEFLKVLQITSLERYPTVCP